LWAFVAVFFGISDFFTDAKSGECSVEYAVSVEIDFASFAGLEKSISLIGEKLLYAGSADAIVSFDVVPNAASVFVQDSLGVVECVFDGSVNVDVGRFIGWVASDDELSMGNGEVDSHVVVPAVMVMPVRRFDDDAAIDHGPEQRIEFVDLLSNQVADGVGGREITER